MVDERGVLKSISWRDLCPWLLLVRVFRLSLGVPLLAVATLGVLVQPLGWRAAEWAFVAKETPRENGLLPDLSITDLRFDNLVGQLRQFPGERTGFGGRTPQNLAEVVGFRDTFMGVFSHISSPVQLAFDPRLSLSQFAYLTAGSLWTLLVWAWCGGLIARTAAVHLGCDLRLSFRRAAGHATRRYFSYVCTPLSLVALTAGTAMIPAALGLLLRADVLSPVAGGLWFVACIAGLVMALCVLALMFSWPLMWGALGAEDSDSFDAFSRSFAYTFQKPLNYLFYAAVAGMLGGLGWYVVNLFSELVISLSLWGASWGAGHERMQQVLNQAEGTITSTGAFGLGLQGMSLWNGLVRSIAAGFTYSYFWCAAAGIYLLLRKDVDHKELDDIVIEEESDDQPLPLSGEGEPAPASPANTGGEQPADGPAASTAPSPSSPPPLPGAAGVNPQPE